MFATLVLDYIGLMERETQDAQTSELPLYDSNRKVQQTFS